MKVYTDNSQMGRCSLYTYCLYSSLTIPHFTPPPSPIPNQTKSLIKPSHLTTLPTYSPTHIPTSSLTHFLTYSPTHFLTSSLTHLLTYSLSRGAPVTRSRTT